MDKHLNKTLGTSSPRKHHIGLLSLGALALIAACGTAQAGSITAVRVEPQTITAGGQAQVTVDGQDGGNCAVRVEYGNGDVDVTRMSAGKDNFPRSFTHTYNLPGTFTILAKGGRDGSTMGCSGESTVTLNVVAAPPPPPMEMRPRHGERYTPACPDGFVLNRNSVNRRTGAYSCSALQGSELPRSGIACPPDTAYYTNEQGTLLGCKALRR